MQVCLSLEKGASWPHRSQRRRTAGEERASGLAPRPPPQGRRKERASRTEGRRHQGHRPGPQATTRGPIAAAAPSQARGTVGPGPRCPRRSNPRPAALVDGRRADQWPALARGGGGKSEIRGPPPPRSRVPSGSPIRIPAASGGACAVRLPGVVPRPTSRRRLAAMPGTIPRRRFRHGRRNPRLSLDRDRKTREGM